VIVYVIVSPAVTAGGAVMVITASPSGAAEVGAAVRSSAAMIKRAARVYMCAYVATRRAMP
jgi:hypothetical protein